MWRSPASRLIRRTLFRRYPATVIKLTPGAQAEHPIVPTPWARHHCLPFSSPASPSLAASAAVEGDSDGSGGDVGIVSQNQKGESISFLEAKKLMRLVNVEVLKRKLEKEGAEVIGYSEMLEVCEATGVARSPDEATAFVKVLDEAGVVLLFRDKVYLHPDKIVDLMSKAVPLALTPENDPRREEFAVLQKKKEEIDMLAHKQVRNILSSGLLILVTQVGLFFRLTFWEFSWDIMEPIAFFTTTTGLIIGYAYFLMTSRDPTYQDFMQRLFLSRQRKLVKKKNFDIERYLELQKHCKCPLGNDSRGMGHDAFHTD